MADTKREQIVKQVAGLVSVHLVPYAGSEAALWGVMQSITGLKGWTVGGVEGLVLSTAELDKAFVLARTWDE